MDQKSRQKGLLKRLLDSRLVWDYLMGPFYSRNILKLLSGIYADLLDAFRPAVNARILDVGCGPGYFSMMLAERYPGSFVTGIDYSSTEIRAAEKQRLEKGIQNSRFIVADAMDLPFEDDSFHNVVSTFSIKHWPDGEAGLREIRRVLAPDGTVMMTEYDRDYSEAEFDFLYTRVKEIAWYLAIPTTSVFIRRVILEDGFSMSEAEDAARSAGFDEIEAEKLDRWPFFLMRLQ